MDLTTKDNVTRDSFQKHTKRFAFVVTSSVSDTNRMTIIITDINRIQKYKVNHNAGITLEAAASGGHWGGGGGGEKVCLFVCLVS